MCYPAAYNIIIAGRITQEAHMTIIARQEEIALLTELHRSSRAEFLALYGRRRVGKTFLIRQFFATVKNTRFFNVTGLKDGSMLEQIENFSDRIGETFYHGAKLRKQHNWKEVFQALNQAIEQSDKNKKIVLFIDEIPWMATAKSNFLQNIDYFWNQYWSINPKIKLIICGSSASWIINKIIKNRGGLHNRITQKICLRPFNLAETKLYLKKQGVPLENKHVLLIYMVTGGIPFYLSKIKWKESAAHIIEKLAFNKNAFLLGEFDNLFSSLFKNHEEHIKIINLLSKNRDGLGKTKLLAMSGSVGGNSSNKLQELEDAGFILNFKPLYHQRKGTYYRLTDEYSYFYLKWIAPNKEMLMNGAFNKEEWRALQLTAEWQSWLGYAFESVCYKHLAQIKRKLELPPMSLASTWRHSPKRNSKESGTQIDLLFDRRDDSISICEIKYSDKPFIITKNYARNLNQKLAVFKEQTRCKKQLLLHFVASQGVTENPYFDEMVSGVVTLDDLFSDK